jgi:hypothetical protein
MTNPEEQNTLASTVQQLVVPPSTGLRRKGVMIWAGAAVAVTALASLAISASVGASEPPLSEQDVAAQLAADGRGADPTSRVDGARPSATTTARTDDTQAAERFGTGEVYAVTGGTVTGDCDSGGNVSLRSWTPNPGYRADDVSRGPAREVSLWWESDSQPDIHAVVSCVDGHISASWTAEADDHGRGRGGGDNSGSGGSGSGRDHPED